MKVLAFDCSTARGSVAVVEGGAAVFAETFECPRGRGGAFFQVLDRAIKTAGKPDRIVVGVGPGSYNGLRAAISAAEGLRLATGADLAGVASVRALPCDAAEYAVVNDVRGDTYCFVKIRGRVVAREIELLDARSVAVRVAAERGPVFTSSPIAFLPVAAVAFPDAGILARMGAAGAPSNRPLEPLYLKPAHITRPKRTGLLPRDK